MPNDPYDRGNWNPAVGAGHAGQVVRLDHIACVTMDMAAVLRFFTGAVDGAVVSDARTSLPQPARRVVIHLGDTDIAFLQPDDPTFGPLGAFLAKEQNGIYALVWAVADEAKARAHFGEKLSLRLTGEGCVSPGFAIEPDDFYGARHEFVAG